MGLFEDVFKSRSDLDSEYAEHLRRLKQVEFDRAHQQAQYNNAVNSVRGAAISQQQMYAHQGLGGTLGAQQKAPRFNPNESEAFQVPMSQLITMWRLKYGDEWYDMQSARPPYGKDFYSDAFDRMNRAQLFESFEGWYRLKEDA